MTEGGKDKGGQGEYLLQLFERGKAFTEQLLRENAGLRAAIGRLQKQVSEGPGFGAPAGGAAEIRKRYDELNAAYDGLRDRYRKLARELNAIKMENIDFAKKYVEIEEQNTSLANLYVASYRLHSTLDFAEVLRIVVEIVINLIGAEKLGVFIFDEETERLECVAHEGLSPQERRAIVIGEGLQGKVAALGESYYLTEEDKQRRAEKAGGPIACIPVKIQDRLIGVLSIYRLLRQKDGFTSIDFKLFDLLAGHAATALYSSRLYALSERKLKTVRSFLDLLKIPRDEESSRPYPAS
ncbi:MAG: GAF domain-containing protein [candidate division Zixibacteria bacterium]|nr:GAF domain-containing protein [candidate division Zixibacteria bacterium]